MWKTRLTLTPGANGTKKLLERYGERLVCVRYRYDGERRKRIKTVELIEEEIGWVASGAVYLVKIAFDEVALRERVKAAGARWNRDRKVWMTTGDVVRRLGLEGRIVNWVDPDSPAER